MSRSCARRRLVTLLVFVAPLWAAGCGDNGSGGNGGASGAGGSSGMGGVSGSGGSGGSGGMGGSGGSGGATIDAPAVDALLDGPGRDAPADGPTDAPADGAEDAASCVCVTPGPCEIGPGTCDSGGLCIYQKRAAGFVCRVTAGSCDLAETCDGTSGGCPGDAKLSAGTVCRAAAGVCDLADSCDGTTAACPTDQLAAAGTTCRVSVGPCDVAEACDGSTVDCPADRVLRSGIVCRAATGVCDVVETCSGVDAACPSDSFASSTMLCRPPAGSCDAPEFCSGIGVDCPVDLLDPAGTVCRASAGVCDVPESCTGSSATCPTDSFVGASMVCRSSAGACDVAENCSGSSATCPPDGNGCNPVHASTATCNGTVCSYTCLSGFVDCNAAAAPNLDGCETAGSCAIDAGPSVDACVPETCPAGANQCEDGCGNLVPCSCSSDYERCSAGSCVCVPDQWEPNDTSTAARGFVDPALPASDVANTFTDTANRSVIETPNIHAAGNVDFYVLQVVDANNDRDAVADVQLTEIAVGNDDDLAIFWVCANGTSSLTCNAGTATSCGGTACCRSANISNANEHINATVRCGAGVPATGLLYIAVSPFAWSSCAHYKLSVNVTP